MIVSRIFYAIGRLWQKKFWWEKADAAYTAAIRYDADWYPAWYGAGFVKYKRGLHAEAERCFRKAAELRPENAYALYRMGLALDALKRKAEARKAYERALSLWPEKLSERAHTYKLRCLEKLGYGDEYVLALQKALMEYPNSLTLLDLQRENLRKRKLWWQLVEFLPEYLRMRPDDAGAYFELGCALEEMGKFCEAAEAFAGAAALKKEDEAFLFRWGYALELAGKNTKADEVYARAIKADTGGESGKFGVGIFFDKRGLFPQAATAYRKELKLRPRSSGLWYRLGMALRHCYRWEEASTAFRHTVGIDWWNAEAHYQLGFVCERRHLWSEAALSYSIAIELSKKPQNQEYRLYRLGRVLAQAGRYEEACAAYLKMPAHAGEKFDRRHSGERESVERLIKDLESQLAKNYTRAHCYAALGECHRRSGDWAHAAQAYEAAIARSEQHRPELHYALGAMLTEAGRFADACAAFRAFNPLGKAYGVDIKAVVKNKEHLRNSIYLEFLEDYPVNTRCIMYETFHGVGITCNPYAIFLHILHDQRYSNFLHIWVLNDINDMPKDLQMYKNVVVVKRNSFRYVYYLATAKFLINNNTFPYYFIRRAEQKYLNTWHGTTLKFLGRDVQNEEILQHQNVTRNFLHATHLISPNAFMTRILLEKYDVSVLYPGVLAEVGYPRIDRMLSMTERSKRDLRNRLGIDENRSVVLYAPTWRGALSAPSFACARLGEDLQKLSALPCTLIFRGHHMVQKLLREYAELSNVVMSGQDTDASEILGITDILITDYSSIFFDFLPSRRPVFFYAYDLEEYSRQQGLYFAMEDLPGQMHTDIDPLVEAVNKQLSESYVPDAKYQEYLGEFSKFEDGKATLRTVDFFFNDAMEFTIQHKSNTIAKNYLFYPGPVIPNGVTESAISLLNLLLGKNSTPTLLISPNSILYGKLRIEKFSEFPQQVQYIGIFGLILMTPEEQWLTEHSKYIDNTYPEEITYSINKLYEREYRRIIGYVEFFSVINFEGYNIYISSLMASAITKQKIIYLHNDMYGEYITRFPYLKQIFRLYAHYDKLISVSSGASSQNQEYFSSEYGIEKNKFSVCMNAINPEKVLEQAEAPLDPDVAAWLGDAPCFVCVGRLSPEKGFDRMIRAFAVVKNEDKEFSDFKLVICGSGPEFLALNKLIVTFGMEKYIKTIGFRANPFPVMKRGDCFILSSLYEGQGLVVLEAMLLERPIISVTIPPVLDGVKYGYACLVEDSEQGLIDGMRKFLDGEVRAGTFDVELYQHNAIDQFLRTVFANDYFEACRTRAECMGELS